MRVRAVFPEETRKQCFMPNSCFISCTKRLSSGAALKQEGSADIICDTGIGAAAGGRVRGNNFINFEFLILNFELKGNVSAILSF